MNLFQLVKLINQTYYEEVSINLREGIQKKRSEQIRNYDRGCCTPRLLIVSYQSRSFYLINKFQLYHTPLSHQSRPLVVFLYFQKLKLTSRDSDLMISKQ